MSEIDPTTLPCCVTDTGAGRIRSEWREGRWVMVERPNIGFWRLAGPNPT